MKAAFHTLGCKTNAYETQAIKEQFETEGFEIVDFSCASDVYVVNTCSVTAVAAQKSRQILHRARRLSPNALIVACGCYAQEAADQLLKDSGVDFIVGNNEKSRIVSLVRRAMEERNGDISEKAKKSGSEEAEDAPLLHTDLAHCKEYEELKITNAGTHVRAYVKIQDGCNRFCSYCIIPYLRGRSRSRRREDILEEIKTLAEGGIREVVLTGIDISDYKESEEQSEGEALSELILKVDEIDGIERIRLGSLEAGLISGSFIQSIKESKKLCPHFHLSLQSGCDDTLKRMNRHYTTAEFSECLALLRDAFSDPAITTDVIAGFAGESEEEFQQTKEYVRNAGFSQLHVFPYSRRKGTRADKMEGQLSRAEKTKRAAELIEIGKELKESYLKRRIGTEIKILTEESIRIGEEEYLVGFTPSYCKAAVRKEGQEINNIVTIFPEKIIEHQGDLVLI